MSCESLRESGKSTHRGASAQDGRGQVRGGQVPQTLDEGGSCLAKDGLQRPKWRIWDEQSMAYEIYIHPKEQTQDLIIGDFLQRLLPTHMAVGEETLKMLRLDEPVPPLTKIRYWKAFFQKAPRSHCRKT